MASPLPSISGYTVEEAFGEGGHGRLFAAVDDASGTPVAIKILHLEDPRARARFYDEARLLSRIRDPHVVEIRGFGELADGRPYIVMERFGDADLSRCTPSGVSAPIDFVVHMMTQILRGLAAAHSAGIVHRDIKESNVLLDRDSMTAKLCDFGIARSKIPLPEQADPTSREVVVGTPHYIAPERYQGLRHDPRSDLYSAGVIFHRLLTGRLPFDAPGADAVVVARKALTEDISHIEGVPESLARVCLGLLVRDVNQRFQSAQAAVDALYYAHRYGGLTGQTLDYLPDADPEPMEPTRRARPIVLGLFIVLVGALVWIFGRGLL